jgi:hypothetical protein
VRGGGGGDGRFREGGVRVGGGHIHGALVGRAVCCVQGCGVCWGQRKREGRRLDCMCCAVWSASIRRKRINSTQLKKRGMGGRRGA